MFGVQTDSVCSVDFLLVTLSSFLSLYLTFSVCSILQGSCTAELCVVGNTGSPDNSGWKGTQKVSSPTFSWKLGHQKDMTTLPRTLSSWVLKTSVDREGTTFCYSHREIFCFIACQIYHYINSRPLSIVLLMHHQEESGPSFPITSLQALVLVSWYWLWGIAVMSPRSHSSSRLKKLSSLNPAFRGKCSSPGCCGGPPSNLLLFINVFVVYSPRLDTVF